MPYTPPFPLRPDRTPGVLELLRVARRNMLAVWPAAAFSRDISRRPFFRRHLVVCNTPETVAYSNIRSH